MARAVFGFLLGMTLLFSAPLQAHRLKVFAFAEGSHIQGSAYFVGGAKASGANISIRDPDGVTLAELAPDAEGQFNFTATRRMDHLVLADSGDGHLAKWMVSADQLPGELPAPVEEQATEPSPRVAPTPPAASATDVTITLNELQLSAHVEQAVARQIRPLREALIAYEDRRRWLDIIGGIGYILGLAGLALWWRSRQPAKKP
ncbi:MAG: hypothetical protein C0631_00295 [Sedimenticola sp.]|nr:MAG: hypothetical protein C0631_00295 [Sedimenticola sp.]